MTTKSRNKDIAIIGMAGQFPKSKNIQELWKHLCQGDDLIHFYSEEELLELGMSNEEINKPNFISAEGNIDNSESFDNSFFEYTKHEAAAMDPQIRLLHEQTWLSLEDAGCDPSSYKGKIGLYLTASDNINWRVYINMLKNSNVNPFYLSQLSDKNFASTLISYKLNLTGPSCFIDTACSSSLVAIHIACRNLLLKECSIAVAGGANVSSSKSRGYYFEEGSKDSRDGYCRAFDKDSSGLVSGEGVGIVVLKKLEDALNDNDHIYAVIRSSSVNNDGNRKIGYTAPSVEGQSECIKTAHQIADIDFSSVNYIEAHGTGTRLGDPIEIAALNKAFGYSTKRNSIAIGSIKTNIGHLDSAAGVAGLIKTSLILKHKKIPASLHYKEPNPDIEFDSGPFYVNTQLREIKRNGDENFIAGISSFGIGGTNAHFVLEEAPYLTSQLESRSFQILKLSGKTQEALNRNIKNLIVYLEECIDVNMPDLAFTFNTGRKTFLFKKQIVFHNRDEAIEKLKSLNFSNIGNQVKLLRSKKVAFMFPGQGAQHLNMCAELYKNENEFKILIDRCFDIVQDSFGIDLKSIVFSDSEVKINDLESALPLLFIFEYSLAKLMITWGIHPDIMIGHSVGEYTAACIGGVFSLEDALRLVFKRGELMQKMPQGKMLSISLSESSLLPFLSGKDGLSLAAVNSNSSCIVSGPEYNINNFIEELESLEIPTKLVRSSHAAHSFMMEDILLEFEEIVNQVEKRSIKIPFISNLTGSVALDSEVSKSKYWVDHLRKTVRFSDGVSELMKYGDVVFVEVGPGKTLSSFVGSNENKIECHKILSLLGHPKEKSNDMYNVLTAVGKIWSYGIEPNWSSFYKDEIRKKISLPTYSFEKTFFPAKVDSKKFLGDFLKEKSVNENKILDCFYRPTWEVSETNLSELPLKEQFFNVIFLDDSSVGEGIKNGFEGLGESVICIRAGKDFKKINRQLFELNPLLESNYLKLFENFSFNILPIRIIFAWGISNYEEYNISKISVRFQLDNCYYPLLNIAKSLNTIFINKKIYLVSITNNLHQVVNKEIFYPDKSPLLGALSVIPKEYTNIRCRNIDLSLNEQISEFSNILFKEIVSDVDDKIIAYRYGIRFVNIIKAFNVASIKDNIFPFYPNKSYLITGGLGGIGLSIAKNICKNVKGVNIFLIGRRELPEKSTWRDYLNSSIDNTEMYTVIKELVNFIDNGNEVYYSSVNLSDDISLENNIRDFESLVGPISGVIHAAGEADFGGIIHNRTKMDSEVVFAPKIFGTLFLSEILSKNNLDFFVLFSSISSIIGHFGEVGHVAGNLFLNSFAKHEKVKNNRILSIGWNAWKEVGQAANEAKRNNNLVFHDSVSPEEGFEVLLRAINSNLPEIFISLIGPDGYLNLDKESDEIDSSQNLPLEKNDFSFENSIENSLIIIWESFFSRSNLNSESDFFELGGDSLKAITLIKRIQKFYGIEISVGDFYSKSNIKDLSNEIELALKFKNIQKSNGKTNIIKI